MFTSKHHLSAKLSSLVLAVLIFAFFSGCESGSRPVDSETNSISIYEQALLDVQYLASDELGGRETGSEGNKLAQIYIENRFQSIGLQMFGDSYRHPFDVGSREEEEYYSGAVNLIGYIEGSLQKDSYIVMTAHYDHLGKREGEIYNGADDNASGTAGLLAAASYFSDHQPENNILFIAFDAEEKGLAGARHFVENPVVPLDQIRLNINMDMISTNFDNELYAVGTYHYPRLKPLIEAYSEESPVDLLFGYDSDEWEQNWTMSSDHGPFHQKGIPFVYFGVVDHEHYHAPTDEFKTINPDFYSGAIETIITVTNGLDQNLDELARE